MRKGIIIGIGILITLLALAGTASAHPSYGPMMGYGSCSGCHGAGMNGTFFNNTHKFNGTSAPVPSADAPNNNCAKCHSPPPGDMSLTSTGQNYAIKHNGMNTSGYIMTGVNCSYCHVDPAVLGDFNFSSAGTTFKQIHKFNGVTIPNNATGCTECHTDVRVFLPLIGNGPFYNDTHRYNDTTLASEMLSSPACGNCHVDVINDNFSMSTGTPYYLTSSTCEACHKAKYDAWRGTNHANKLVNSTRAQEMLLPDPAVYTNNTYNWSNVSYVVIGLTGMYYLNETGYIFKKYNATNMSLDVYVPHTPGDYRYSSCGRCHTTGYNSSGINALPGIVGTWNETGIACERCHNAGGNGHQVQTNVSASLCLQCHSQKWSLSAHAPPLNADTTCLQCHSPFDYYKNNVVSSTSATGVVCDTCHNPHDITADGYRSLYSTGGFNATVMAQLATENGAKVSFFNSTASNSSRLAGLNASLTAGNDIYDDLASLLSSGYALLFSGTDSRKDASYGSAPINVTGPTSEVLCSMCHYEHGLGQIAKANLTHGRNSTSDQTKWATCTDCHMAGAGNKGDHSFNALNATNFPTNTCSRGTECHVTSGQNRSLSDLSLISVQAEWKATAHNDIETSINHSNPNSSFYRSINGTTGNITVKSRQNSCNKCHSPINWNPAQDANTTNVLLNTTDFKGITCTVCHNIHDMGDWITKTGKVYGWYNGDAINNSGVFQANYTVMDDTTELCGNCHANIRAGNTGPGWSNPTTPIKPHGIPAKDIFVGSFKQTSLNFECKDCHMYMNKTDGTGTQLNDTDKVTGHSFAVNESGLQSTGLKGTEACSQCHVNGTVVDTIPNVIAKIQADTQTKWNATNITVQGALASYRAYTGEKNLSADKISQAYWNLYDVQSDGSWGVHDPVGTNKLLDDAAALANEVNVSLGQGRNSTVNLTAGWNLVALNGTPSVTTPVSVMSSVASNITVVWGFNGTTKAWELYDPLMPSGLNTLTSIVPGKGYWINAVQNCVWTI